MSVRVKTLTRRESNLIIITLLQNLMKPAWIICFYDIRWESSQYLLIAILVLLRAENICDNLSSPPMTLFAVAGVYEYH